jgi:prepilin-type processing-associated H-X9-DG protein/prepilin-type N-terminal cleavage/methylation domain-containing protein
MNKQPSHRSASGVTLIEILVVLAVLGVLAALLFPVLFTVRRKAGQATCRSNEHQIGQAFAMYVSDWDGRWPPAIQGVGLPNAPWEPKIQPYLKARGESLDCPQAVRALKEGGGFPGYSMNGRIHMYSERGAKNPDGSYKLAGLGLPDANIAFPATTVSLCEAAWGWGDYSSPNPIAKLTIPPDPMPEDASQRHEKGANYLFCDGHVKWHTPDSVLADGDHVQDGSRPSFAVAWKH